jgi:uncharacterized protein (DUF952 family)
MYPSPVAPSAPMRRDNPATWAGNHSHASPRAIPEPGPPVADAPILKPGLSRCLVYPMFVIFHVVALDDWLVVPDRPYAPASLSEEGFVHCSPDEAVTLAVASTFYRDTPGPLMVLFIDEHKLDTMVRWEAASPVPPTGVAPDTLFPHVYGTINRDAVEGMMEVQRNTDGHAVGLAVWP